MPKVLLIDNCTECGKWFIRYGFSKDCRKLGRKLTSSTDEIPYDCPLADADSWAARIELEEKANRSEKLL